MREDFDVTLVRLDDAFLEEPELEMESDNRPDGAVLRIHVRDVGANEGAVSRSICIDLQRARELAKHLNAWIARREKDEARGLEKHLNAWIERRERDD